MYGAKCINITCDGGKVPDVFFSRIPERSGQANDVVSAHTSITEF